jgi:hypothetical protein
MLNISLESGIEINPLRLGVFARLTYFLKGESKSILCGLAPLRELFFFHVRRGG